MESDHQSILDEHGLQSLLDILVDRGYRVVGPTVRDGSIVYDDVASVSDLPRSWRDEQDGGHYRLKARDDAALFGFAVGPHSWKKYLLPPTQRLWQAKLNDGDVEIVAEPPDPSPLAFIGVRACELHAIAIQDRVLRDGAYADPHYRARRENCLIVALNCSTAGGTCFCTSMGTGPRAESGYDIALTELAEQSRTRFVAEAGSENGRDLLAALDPPAASAEDRAAAQAVVERTAASMGRAMRSDDVHDLLLDNLDHARWDDVAARCLSCTNCTMVCPTCFCTTVEESSDLAGTESARTRHWDSCFTLDFSYLHGGSVRSSTRSRYRQWMTHKLATWYDQFGSSGCVGCGRCITWCPVGIDITEEVAAIRGDEPGEGNNDGD